MLQKLPTKVIENSVSDLIRRFKQRDLRALAELYGYYNRILYILIVRIVHDPPMAEELVHESLVRAWHRSEEAGETAESFSPWLIAIARECASDYLEFSPEARAFADNAAARFARMDRAVSSETLKNALQLPNFVVQLCGEA